MTIGSFTLARCLTFMSAGGARRLLPLAGLLLFAAVPLRAQRVVATVPAGAGPVTAAVNPVTNRIYIANSASANVTVIDGATNATSTIATGSGPRAIAINPATNRIYVVNGTNSSVTAIDGASGFTTAIPVGVSPYGIALNPATNKIYVTSGTGTVRVIDGWSNTVITVISGSGARGVAVNPVTNRVYAANSSSISVIDGASDTVLTTIPTPGSPDRVAVNPVTNRIYVSDGIGFGAVDVINGADNSIVSLPLAGPQNSPSDIAVNPVTNKIYITNRSSGSITVVDGLTNGLTPVAVGSTPAGLAIDQSANKIYVPNNGGTSVTVVDGVSLATSSLTVGAAPGAAAVNPVTHRVYVANDSSNNVSVIDGASYGTTMIAVGTNPNGVDINPVTNKIYVLNGGSSDLTVIDGATGGTSTISGVSSPYRLAVNPITNRLYVSNSSSATVTVIDGISLGTTIVPVGVSPGGIAVNPLTNRIYVANLGSASVTVINGDTNATTTVSTGAGPRGVAVNPVTNRIYITNFVSNSVTVIEGSSNNTVTVPVGVNPFLVAVNPITNKVYVSNNGGGNVTVIDGETHATSTVSAGIEPAGIAVNSASNRIYVANNGSDNITIIDGVTLATTTLTAGSGPIDVALNTASNKIYITNFDSANITVIDGVTNQTTQIAAGTNPEGMAVNPVTGKAYITNQGSSNVTVITENPALPVPLTATITPFPGDTTSSLTPTFTGTASSTFTPIAPPPQNVYYQLDSRQGSWTQSIYNVPGMSWSGNSPPLSVDAHILYAFAADNQDACTVNPGVGSSPLTGEMTAYYFVVSPPLAIITPSLPDGEVGLLYSRLLTANGGTWSGYLWSALTSLPAGLTLTPGGLLSGTPTASGFVNLSLQVTDSGIGSATRAYSFQIYDAVSITTASLPNGEVGFAYNQTINATGGSFSGYAWSVDSGLPPGMTFSAAGVLSGAPTVSGAQSFTARVTDSVGGTATRNFAFTIFAPLTLDTLSLPDAEVWSSYNQPLASSGGSGGNFWSAPSGMPSGMGLNGSTGEVFGSPNNAGFASFTIQVQDSVGATALRTFNITIHPQLVITTSSLPYGEVSFAYSQSLGVTGGSGGNVWSVISGLPDGLTFSAAGLLSGIPTTANSYNFNARVTDSLGYNANVNIFINIYSAINIATASVPDMIVNTPQNFTFSVNGGAGSYVWSVVSGLPPGLSLSTDGWLTGTPTAASSASMTIRVSDSLGYFVTRTYTFEVYVQLVITTVSLPDGEVSFPYSATFAANGGTGGNVWSAPFGTPPGLSLSAAGVLDGTPTTNIPASLYVVVTDNRGHSANQSFSFNIYSALNISTASLPDGEVTLAYSQALSAGGGSGGNVWSVDSGLPAGMILSAGGMLSGTPTVNGPVVLQLRVTDSLGHSATATFNFTIHTAITVTTATLPDGEVNLFYNQTLGSSGGSGGNGWSVDSGLPAGLSLSAAGQLSGTPSASGAMSLTVRVSDSVGGFATRNFNFTIFPALAITTASLPPADVAIPYSVNLASSGGSGGNGWSVLSGLPDGLTFSAGGLLSGTPTTAGPVSLNVQVTDSLGALATRLFNFTIAPPVAITTASLANGEINLAYNRTLAASGGSGGNGWSVVSGMPSGLTLSASGVLSGVPSSSGAINLTVRVTDMLGSTATRTFSFTIYIALTITSASIPNGTVGVAYSTALAASGGSGGNGWVLASGQTPSGLSFSASGVLSGTPLVGGSYNFTARVTDSLGATRTRPYTLTIVQPLAIVNPSLTQGVVGERYPYTALQVAGGFPQFVFSVTAGALPSGITMNSNGQFTGTPDTAGSTPVTFTVTDATNATASRAYVMVVALPPNEPLWAARGRFGGKVQDVRVSPDYASDTTLLAMSEAGELFRSSNKGASWSRSLVNPARAYTFANRFRLSPVFSGVGGGADAQTVLFASYDAGVWISTDRGDTFTASSSGIPCAGAACGPDEYPQIIGLAISPNFVSDRTLWAADFDNNLFRSTNGGAGWTPQAILSAPTGGLDTVITPSPSVASDRTLFIGIANRIFRTLDGGATWTQVYAVVNSFGQPLTVRALVISPSYASDHTLLVEAEGFRLYRTRDAGVNFADISTPASAYGEHLRVTARPGMPALWTMESPNASAFVYRLLASEDYGTTFTPLFAGGMSSGNEVSNALAPSPPVAGAIDFYYATEQGLYASYDNGFSFEQQDNGLGANVVYNAAGAGDVVTEGYKGGWFKSADQGATRTRLAGPNASSGFKDVFFSAVSPDYPVDHVIFLGDALALMRSENGGQSFVPALSAPANNMSAAFMPGFSGAPGAPVATMLLGTDSGLFRSNDGGRSFYLFSLPSPTCSSPLSPAIQGVAIAGDGTIFVASAVDGSDGGLCKSVDGGASWTRLLNAGQPVSGPVALSSLYSDAAPDGPARTIMVYQLRSTDGGATWAPAGGPANLNGAALFSPTLTAGGDPTVFLYGDGIFRSSDFGASFSALGAGDALRGRTVTGLTLPAGFDGRTAAGVAVAATNGSGVYRSTDGGRGFAPSYRSASLEAVVNDLALVSGGATIQVKNKAGRVVNTITADSLLAATQGQGVFQSDDGGVTFTSISAGLPANANARAITVPSAALTAPLTAVAGTGLWRYGGGSWSQVTGLDTGTYTQFIEDDLYLYATRADGVSLRADRSGGNWTPLEASLTDLAAMDYNPSLTLAGGGLSSGIEHRASSIDSPSAVTASLWSASAGSGALYSLNNGTNWITANGGGDYTLPAGPVFKSIRALGINSASGGREVIVGTGTGLYKSLDGGINWRSVSGSGSGLEGTSRDFAALLSTPTAYSTTDVLVGAIGSTTGGVYLSGDGGEHWTQINQGFDPNSLSISTLVKTSCSGCPVQYYTGTYGSGVYTRTIAVVAPPAVTGWFFGSTSGSCAAAAGSGPEQGGQPFKLCGTGFLALPTVEFDGVPATGCVISGATVITCTGTPPHVPGAAVIKVRNSDTRSGAAATPYQYLPGSPRVLDLLVAKSGSNAQLSWSCTGCTSGNPARIFRGQNAPLTLNRENYTSATPGSFSNIGALGTGSNPSYFWSVE